MRYQICHPAIDFNEQEHSSLYLIDGVAGYDFANKRFWWDMPGLSAPGRPTHHACNEGFW